MNLDWRPQASKMVVLIADAPPHGIGEYGDGALSLLCSRVSFLTEGFPLGFDDGSPDGKDPLQIVRLLASRGITLVCAHFVIYKLGD